MPGRSAWRHGTASGGNGSSRFRQRLSGGHSHPRRESVPAQHRAHLGASRRWRSSRRLSPPSPTSRLWRCESDDRGMPARRRRADWASAPNRLGPRLPHSRHKASTTRNDLACGASCALWPRAPPSPPRLACSFFEQIYASGRAVMRSGSTPCPSQTRNMCNRPANLVPKWRKSAVFRITVRA